MNDEYTAGDDPLNPILDRVPIDVRASARETLRWFVEFTIRLSDRMERESVGGTLDTPPKAEHRASEKE